MSGARPLRLAVYLDYVHRREGSTIYAPRAFALFVAGLRPSFDRVVVAGRVDPQPGRSHYPLEGVEFLELPHYESAASPAGLARAAAGALRRWDGAVRDADVVWVLGPQGLALPLVALALARRKRVVLGVRQDLPEYARSRHPGRRLVHAAADLLDGAFRALARFLPVIVVGPALAGRYRRGRAVLPLTVSLTSERELAAPPPARRWDGDELRVLSVGRLEAEKNPLLLADVLARLRAADPRWRLVVCGEGPLDGALRARLSELELSGAADLRGYLPLDDGLRDAYREAHALLHVSWTEGLPQVLFEAFAASLPVVATAVGSVREAGGDAVLLVAPGDPEAPAEHLAALARDAALRERLVRAGLERARAHSMEAELARAARFLAGA
ncbi:MAG TPA: glycosyltransferase [Solirubrobacteraceae bacterium]|nr:glycosyltransferase [Solirubrobacteraceae bacterium]